MWPLIIFYLLPVLCFVAVAIAIVMDKQLAEEMNIESYGDLCLIIIAGLIPLFNFVAVASMFLMVIANVLSDIKLHK